jgi:tetratricopeptide (TPR) repeat protein
MSTERTAQEWYERGYALRGQNDLDGARDAFQRAISGEYGVLPPFSQAGALRALGELADIRDDVSEAIRLYRAAVEVDPKIGVSKRLAALERSQSNPRGRKLPGRGPV